MVPTRGQAGRTGGPSTTSVGITTMSTITARAATPTFVGGQSTCRVDRMSPWWETAEDRQEWVILPWPRLHPAWPPIQKRTPGCIPVGSYLKCPTREAWCDQRDDAGLNGAILPLHWGYPRWMPLSGPAGYAGAWRTPDEQTNPSKTWDGSNEHCLWGFHFSVSVTLYFNLFRNR